MGAKDRTNSNKLRRRDVFVILLCISGAAYSIYLFWLDLNQTLNSQTEQVGTITIKSNIVQRRIAKRVIWDRLFNESPVYLGDMIRVADLSSATLNIDENKIGLEENTLVLIQRSASGDLQINLASGTLNYESPPEGSDTNIVLNIMGREVTVSPGTTLKAAAAEDGMQVQIIEGTAQVRSEGEERELSSGSLIALDADGTEQALSAVVMLNPRPNAYYLANGTRPLAIDFSWNRINLQPYETLSLEIAEDQGFSRIIQRIEDLDTRAAAQFVPGLAYWRLSLDGAVLSKGQITVTSTSGPTLINPAQNQEIYTRTDLESLSFQWSEIDEVSNYVLQVGTSPDFSDPRINRLVATNSFTATDLESGAWYWRVLPVFPSIYEGRASYSSPAQFRITQTNNSEVLQLAVASVPEPEFVVAPPPPRVTPRPPPPLPRVRSPATPPPRPAPAPPRPDVAPEPRPVAVPPRLLPAAENMRPAAGTRIGTTELRSQRNINFRWAEVPGANAYIFTLYQEGANGRREIISSAPENRTSWTVDNLQLLDQGTFVWQVEAVNMEENGTIVQRGTITENTLILDIPLPGEVKLEQPGVLYGN